MKKTGMMHRVLALLLVLIMTVQMLPLGVFATFGDLQSWNPGVDLSTLKQEDAINWPIKVYDYLSDGMLFEWMDTNTTTSSSSPTLTFGNTDGTAYASQYGGGYKPPATALGIDFTYGASNAWGSSTYSPKYCQNNNAWGTAYTITQKAAVDFSSPMYMRITDGTNGGGRNMMLTRFGSNQSTAGNLRYMTLIYRCKGLSDDTVQLRLTNETSSFTGVKNVTISINESTTWAYQIIDLYSLAGAKTDIQYIWFTCYNTKDTSQLTSSYAGMDSGDYLDLAYVGYFNNTTEATNYAGEALKFIANPGEYLGHSSTTTYTHSYVTLPKKSDYLSNIFSLNYCWKNKDTTPKMFDSTSNAANVRYGLDFTTHSTDNGWKTNAYTSDTFWSWSNGTSLSLKNTTNNVTRTESFSMSNIGVEQMTQSNGAQYVRLTTSAPSKILLSKFREDHQLVQEGYVPLTADVYYMVLVYRPNGLTSSDPFGFWAHGYLDSSSPDSHKTANYWKHAGLTKVDDWTTADNVKKLYFSDTSGWQYRIIEVPKAIAEADTDMSDIDRLANLGMYLPKMDEGESLDIAFVSFFKNNPNASDGMQFETAVEFATNAVNYMNAAPTVTQDVNESKTYAATRKWYGGGNKSFGMLYSSGGGQYWPGSNSGGESTSSNQYDYGYEFDTWMIGYRTNAVSSNSFNTARYQLVYNSTTGLYEKKKFTANYTGTTSGYDNLDFIANPTGTTNNVYFLAATEEDADWGSNDGDDTNGKDFNTKNMVFDGYNILQTMTSGVMTAGLLEGGLQTVTVDGVNYRVPVYRQETVEYIAYNLLHGLRIPMKDSSGNYNTRYIKGTESTKYGGVDLNGDGKIGMINYDGDSRNGNETNEASVDLATALRHELGLSPRLGNSVNVMTTDSGVDSSYTTYAKQMGKYEDTLAKSRMLFGEFSDCRNAIDTAMDAAYYLLNNIFISNSYNQEQDDYEYLTLSSATVNALGHSGFAYVFDAGFTTGSTGTYGEEFTDDGTNKSAIKYSPYGSTGGTGTISMENVTGKTRFDYGTRSISWTTRFPFLPITDAEGDFAGQTKSYYFLDDAQRVYTEGSNSYKNRNFNYVIASNGEFVYREEDDLFFEFEGDDDVYLFINGELVLDIGGAHSITSVYIDVNDYVNAAAAALADLAQYGYNKDMPIDQFDSWISAANIAKLDANMEPTGETVANPYTADQIATFKRQHRLNLSDGQICQFDFYYMERHGWGANMRIVTNMHITDPALSVDKTAYQFGNELEYGGVIDPTSSVEYSFKLVNTGNTKLYNLTWSDEVLGLTMDPDNGLVIDPEKNGTYVLNKSGGYLKAKDLTAIVTGKDINGNETNFEVSFDEVNGDGGQDSLKKFLWKLESDDGTSSGYDDAEVTNAGSGLWVGGSVQFRGIYYMLTPEQTDAGMVDNTVYVTGTTRTDPNMVGNRILRSDASHRLYTNGFPIHYQWAGHNIFMNLEHLLTEAKTEAQRAGSQLSEYQNFFKNVTLANLLTAPCDKFGRVGGDYSSFLTAHSDTSGHSGYLINYKEPGVYTFYLLLYMKNGNDKNGTATNFEGKTVNAADIGSGYYAILRSQVFVADVKDSVYVLDYGLSTESLDADGVLFEDDYLFGPYGSIRAKLMGITGGVYDEETKKLVFTEPSFIDPKQNADATKTGIKFDSVDDTRIYGPNGFFNANLAIPDEGKEIAYDSNKGQYTLTGVGTTKIKVVLPTVDEGETDPWATPYLHCWYDDGTVVHEWPGVPLKSLGGGGLYEVDIPADIPNVIVNNGSAAKKTEDLKITPGLETTITVYETTHTVGETVYHDCEIETVVQDATLHVKVPADWENVYVHHWHDNGEKTEYPGDQLTEVDSNGYYTITVHGDVTDLLITDGVNKKTLDLKIYAGKEVWFEVGEDVVSTSDNEDGTVTNYYDTTIKYTLSEGYVVHASVPKSWKDTIYLYYWHEGMTDDEMVWPGVAMTKGEAGWYTSKGLVPADITMLIINDGKDSKQTVDISVTPGLETWVMVDNKTVAEGDSKGKYTAQVAYGSEASSTGLTFTPKSFMDDENNMWMAITVHSTSFSPTALGTNIDIHNEVQMYKKITVLPATVVYYEDTFVSEGENKGINYITSDTTEGNSFIHHGNGSGRLTQSVDQDMPYGQDPVYQNDRNNLYSGQSMTAVQIKNTDKFATFTFKGTGFELISRTNAFDSATTVARVYKATDYYDGIHEDYVASVKKYNVYIGVKTTYEKALAAYNDVQTKYEAAVAAYNAAKTAYEKVEEDATTYQYRYEEYLLAVKLYEDSVKVHKNAMIAYNEAVKAYKEYHNISDSSSSSEAVAPVAVVEPSKQATYTKPVAPETLIGTAYVAVTEPTNPMVRNVPVITQFDHGNDGGKETINQVPTLRVTGLDWNEYVVELAGVPAYTFDENYNQTGIADSYVYIDGLRIFQPMGATNDAYSAGENGAVVEELRNLILDGKIGVGMDNGSGLQLSTGTVTWTENLPDNDFYVGNYETYEGIIVGSADDYLMQGPNNEVYMEGNAANNALVFYVTETAGADAHELQIAVRGLDYSKFYGAGSSAIDAQLQYGILNSKGEYVWKSLARVVSGTEQYYTIPYAECPVDQNGRYQIALRAVNVENNRNALVSYTSVKRKGLEIVEVEGLGENTILTYDKGMLIQPQYELVVINAKFNDIEVIPFTGSELSMTLERDYTYVYIRSTLNGTVYNYYAKSDPGAATSATMYMYDDSFTRYSLDIPKGTGEVTLKIKQGSLDQLELSYCMHTWGDGLVAEAADCSNTGVMAYTCTTCGHMKQEVIETNSKHTYANDVCVRCGVAEPDYYLIGYINGANYGCEEDWANTGEYKFVDGKLVVTFNENSYVFIKKGTDNPETFVWYMTPSYCSEKTGVFSDTNTGNSEKMLIPGNVEVTLTLEEDGYGSLILSYSVPCEHNYDEGTIMLAATCTAEGEKEYYCSKCGHVKTEILPIIEHTYKDGYCTGCGTVQMRTIYLLFTEEWTDTYAYVWTDATEETEKEEHLGAWPGTQMELISDEIARITVPVTAKKIIFHDGNGTQTSDMDIPTDGRDLYNLYLNEWQVRSQIVDYYLIGYINGADYGCEGDSANLGDYKFVNGELTATFDQTSYVFIKTTGNLNWYMTDGWMGDNPTTVTLYNTTADIEHNKMMVPGGVELTFTLVKNDDDTLTLTVHAWTVNGTKSATCTEDGSINYTCSIGECAETKTVVIPATGHNYVDGVCQNASCQTQKTHRIYYKNSAGWSNVNIYAWTDANSTTTEYTSGWPGSTMSYDADLDLYYFDLATNAMSVIFNNGTTQTGNLTAPQESSDERVYYDYASTWGTIDNPPAEPEEPEESETQTLYLVPNSNWTQSSARFAAYFFGGTSAVTWVDMTDADGDGTYECQIPSGDYLQVIFCRMDPGNSTNDWGAKWNQTGDLTIPTDGTNMCTINDGQWDCGSNVTWSTYTPAEGAAEATATFSARMVRALSAATVEETATTKTPDMYVVSYDANGMNLYSINRQMSSNIIYGEMDLFEPGNNQPEEDTTDAQVDINGVMLQLSDDISVVFKAEVPADASDVYMVFTFNGVQTTVTDYTVDDNGKYCYTFTGINPQLMGDTISATLYATVNGTAVSDTVADYSVLKYCTGMLNKDISDEFRTLISDLLVYGAKAQQYIGYKTDALVTDGLELSASTFTELDNSYDKRSVTGQRNSIHDVSTVSLHLSNKVAMRFGFVLDDPSRYTYEVTINGETLTYTADALTYDADTNRYYLIFSEIYATEFDEVVSIVVKENGEVVSRTMEYSVNTYIYMCQNTEDVALREMLHAIFNYGRSAEAFLGAQS